MSWRTVIISNQAKLDYKMGFMVVRGEETKRVVIDEIATLVIENPAVSLTGCLIEVLIEKKVRVIFCDSKRSPAICDDYDSLGEKIIDYFELIQEFIGKKLFVTVNLRSYISDKEAELFMQTALSHQFNVLMIENCEHKRLSFEKRLIVDADLCLIS